MKDLKARNLDVEHIDQKVAFAPFGTHIVFGKLAYIDQNHHDDTTIVLPDRRAGAVPPAWWHLGHGHAARGEGVTVTT